jgi:hypothetical protein
VAIPPARGDVPFADVLTDVTQLRDRHAEPSAAVAAKKIDHVDAGAASLIAASSLVLVATADATGRSTVSPRGGPAGFVRVLDPHRLALTEAPGNRLLDSSRNLLENPQVGMLFVVPGQTWTLRVEGRAWLTTDPAARDPEHPDRLVLGVQVRTVFVHCGRAFDLGHVWEPAAWPQEVPDATAVFLAHVAANRAAEPRG